MYTLQEPQGGQQKMVKLFFSSKHVMSELSHPEMFIKPTIGGRFEPIGWHGAPKSGRK